MDSIKDLVKEKFIKMGINTIPCRNCQEEIFFLKTKTGKLMPVDLELESHFAKCPGANKFRKNYNKPSKWSSS